MGNILTINLYFNLSCSSFQLNRNTFVRPRLPMSCQRKATSTRQPPASVTDDQEHVTCCRNCTSSRGPKLPLHTVTPTAFFSPRPL